MTGDTTNPPDFSDVPFDDGPEDPTPADVPRGEAEVPPETHTDRETQTAESAER